MIQLRSCSRAALARVLILLSMALAGALSIPAHAANGDPLSGADRIFRSGFEKQGDLDSAELLPPADSQLAADALPEVGLRLPVARLQPHSWQLLLDGEDVTGQAQSDAQSIVFRPEAYLPAGIHTVEVRLGTSQRSWQFETVAAPAIHDTFPDGLVLRPEIWPRVSARYAAGAIDPARMQLRVDGVDVSASAEIDGNLIEYASTEPFARGIHTVSLSIRDALGNLSQREWRFAIAGLPEIGSTSPQGTLTHDQSRPLIEFEATDASAVLDPDSVRMFVDLDEVTASLQIETLASGQLRVRYQPVQPLAPGQHGVMVAIGNAHGALAEHSWSFELEQLREYTLEVLRPAAGSVQLEPEVEVAVSAASNTGPVQSVRIGSRVARAHDAGGGNLEYRATVPLQAGENTLQIRATFADGGERETALDVSYAPPPQIRIESPADWTALGPPEPIPGAAMPGASRDLTGAVQRQVTISGVTTAPAVSVQINQQQAQLGADGLSFTFPNYFLHEGTNLISAVVTDAHGRTASSQITLYVDHSAPLLTVESPADSSVTSAQRIDVSGVINDAVESRVSAPQPGVQVRNEANQALVDGEVGNLGYLVGDIPLEVGLNRLTVTARDALGNSRSREVRVIRTAVGAQRLLVLDGNRQRGNADAELTDAITVQAIDAAGDPLRNVAVRFDLLRGSGSLRNEGQPANPDGVNPARNLDVVTDADGMARVYWRLGSDARPGSDVLRASLQGTAESVFVTATALTGTPGQIGIHGSGGTQYVAAGSPPVEALMAQVLDVNANPVEGALVEFRVLAGAARFLPGSAIGAEIVDAGQALRTRTDRTGVATARPWAGETPGTLVIGAQVLRDPEPRLSGAVFQLEVLARSEGPTRMSGVVLDHGGAPVAGVRLSIDRTALTVISDAQGRFEFADQVPAGKIDLFVDGRDVRFERGGATFEYPALHFETAVVQGQDNQLPHPIFLPPVELSRAVVVGGNEDVVLSMPGFEGFEMRVRANSVTFPDGSRSGELVVTPVHNDRLPMVPPGMAGRFAGIGWTLQPTNTRFDPPIEVHIPNTDGLRPGRTVPIVQWDHDLAAFVPMGNGTVSEDGTRIVSDPGSGITKAGWGGGGPPPPPPNCGTDGHAPVIQSVTLKAFGTPSEEDEPLLVLSDQELADPSSKGLEVEVEADRCPNMDIGWDLGNGQIIEDTRRITLEHFSSPGTYEVTPFVECYNFRCGDRLNDSHDGTSRKVHVVKLKLESGFSEQTDNPQANGFKHDLPAENATGYAERPYALMGARSGDRACIRIDFELEGDDEGKDKLREALKFAFSRGGQLQGDSGPNCDGAGEIEGEKVYLSLQNAPFSSMWPVAGLDDNDDGRLSPNELAIQKFQWLYLMVSDATRSEAIGSFNSGMSNFGSLGQQWLGAFRDGTVPGDSVSVNEGHTVGRAEPGLTHANGLRFPPGNFNSAKRGESRKVTHQTNAFIVRALQDSPNMRNWLMEGSLAHLGQILVALGGTAGPVTLDFTFSNGPVGTGGSLHQLDKATFWRSGTAGVQGGTPPSFFSLPYPDLYAAVGDAGTLTLRVRIVASASSGPGSIIEVDSLEVLGGTANDLFDWDLDVNILGVPSGMIVPTLGPMARGGAKLQGAHLGKSSARPGGMVFENEYLFGPRTYSGFTLLSEGVP
jgi:hypothetical protein